MKKITRVMSRILIALVIITVLLGVFGAYYVKRLVDDELNVNTTFLQVMIHSLSSCIIMNFNNFIINITVCPAGIISQ